MPKIHLCRLICQSTVLCGVILITVSLRPLPDAISAPGTSTTWSVTSASDNVNDGDLDTRSGSLRFALAHATSGDFVSFTLNAENTIVAGSTLTVPVGVAVGRTRAGDCGNVNSPLANITANNTPYISPRVDPVISLSADSTLRNVDVAGGYNSIKITGTNVDVCGIGVGITSGESPSLPPYRAALIVEGDHAVVHRNIFNSFIVVGTHGSDTRIGDTLHSSGDSNQGLCGNRGLCGVTVYADSSGAAQRVTIRDSFARGLTGLIGNGVSGGDDNPKHANNWAQTPTILTAETLDNFATVHISGVANPLSLVDIYFDDQASITRQSQVTATAAGTFDFTGALLGSSIYVGVMSTLNDPAHPNRIGSSSQFSDWHQVTVGVNPNVLHVTPTSLAFSAVAGDPNPPDQYLAVTAPASSPTLAWQTSITTTGNLNWLSAIPISGSGDGTISVTVDATGLVSGTYHGFVTVFDPAQLTDRATADVLLQVTEPTLQVSPNALEFTVMQGDPSPSPQQLAVTIQPISPTLMWTTEVTTTDGVNWLAVAPTSSSGDDVLNVTADPTFLAAGTYHGQVKVYEMAKPTDRVTATVTLNVLAPPPPPTLQLLPGVITFTAILSEPAPLQQLIVSVPPVSPTLSWTTNVTTTDGMNWLNVLPLTGSGDSALSVIVDPTDLPVGTYTGQVKVFDPDQPDDQATTDVVLIVVAKRVWLPLIIL